MYSCDNVLELLTRHKKIGYSTYIQVENSARETGNRLRQFAILVGTNPKARNPENSGKQDHNMHFTKAHSTTCTSNGGVKNVEASLCQ